MDAPGVYRARLESLKSKPEMEATEALRRSLSKGTSAGGLTFSRADINTHVEHVHHYFGCPDDGSCDHLVCDKPLPWESNLLVPVDDALSAFTSRAPKNDREWMHVSQAVYLYGNLIRDRWLKMSPSQRRDILTHRPDIDECIPKSGTRQQRIIRYERDFTHFDIEHLTKPNSLLILLDARAKNAPYKFALSDHELALPSKLRSSILESTKHTMGINNREYGVVQEWTSEEAAAQAMAEGEAVHPVHGMHIMATQSYIYQFLKGCIIKIIPDKPQILSGGSNFVMTCEGPVFVSQEPRQCCLTEGYSSSPEDIVRESRYRAPTLRGLYRLQAFALRWKNQAEEHIWMLRQDPGYFAEAVKEHKEHRPELLLGSSCGKVHETGEATNIWARTLRDSVANCYIDLFVWDKIFEDISEVVRLWEVHDEHFGEGTISMSSELSPAFSDSLIKTWSFLELIQLDLIQQLKSSWSASLEVRPFYVQVCGSGEDGLVLGVKHKDGGRREHKKELEHVFRYIEALWDPIWRQSVTIHALMGSIQHHLGIKERAIPLTSPLVVSVFSKLAVVSQSLRELELFQPSATKIAHSVKKRQTELLIDHSLKFAEWRPILQTDFNNTALVALGKPVSQFHYPVKKRPSQAKVEMLRNAETALDAFWAAADARFVDCTGTTPHSLVRHILTNRPLRRTPPWEELVKDLQSALAKQAAKSIYIPIPHTLHDPTAQITGAFDRFAVSARSKVKTKTHGPAHTDSGHEDDKTRKEVSDEQPTFTVDQRAHKVFSSLFHSPFSKNRPGDIPWLDFIHAMVAVGFAAHKLQGSAWQFTPVKLDVQQPIQFHEPHPTHKMPFSLARHFGRRLARTYGWKGDMFQLAV